MEARVHIIVEFSLGPRNTMYVIHRDSAAIATHRWG